MKVRENVGMVFQHFHLFPHKTVLDNLTYAPMKVKGLSKEEAAKQGRELLKKVGFADKEKHILIDFQVDKNNGSPLPGHWQWTRKLCFSMSLLLRLIRKWSKKCLSCYERSCAYRNDDGDCHT